MARGRYDVFLSYKSEDVRLVRHVAEALLANQYAVWFAEYQVLLRSYDRFQEAIDDAIPNARFAHSDESDRAFRMNPTGHSD
jgi:hypothetical protein